ncbi:Gfo/Idh/MocA family oxidoreductase [candidate division KSB1 bacterium]|nr:Gfo/Idh/MocA family oxidoreductase [candidate division KSB1 bacterium]
MQRRQFIKKSAKAALGALSFPYLIPASAIGRNNYVPPSDRIVMGCIGLGGQGTHNMRTFLNLKGVQVVALCDVDKGSSNYHNDSTAGLEPAVNILENFYAEQMGTSKYKGFTTHEDFRGLLDRENIDAVTVCTPDHWHGLISIAAAKAGKDIYCEKPLTNTIEEGRAVCDAVKRYHQILQTGSHERSNDSVRFACELVRNGRIGEIKEIHVNMPNSDPHHLYLINDKTPKPKMPVPDGFNYDMWLGPTPEEPYTKQRCHFWWRFILQYGGGEMTDRGAHIIDLAQFINNMDDSGPVEIYAEGNQLENELFNAFYEYKFELTYSNGVKILGGSEGERGLKIIGTDGWIFIHIHGGRLEAYPESLLREKIAPGEIRMGRSPSHQQNFIDAVKSRKQPFATAEIGHRTATICHLINIGMLMGRKLGWDPVNEEITNDFETNQMLARPMRYPWHL